MNRFTVTGKVGEGCFGTVLSGYYNATGSQVALKKVPINRLDEGLPSCVVREMLSLQRLNHPHIVRLLEAFPSGSSMVLVTEHCARDLQALMKCMHPNCRMPFGDALTYLWMVLLALDHCHSNGVLHRDIKPSNLLVTASRQLKLADFGLARIYDADADMTHEVATRWYRAVELLFGERRYGPSVDMWSVGCVFAEMLAGCGNCVLFAGEGDIDQINKIFRVLGTPTEDCWPGVTTLPDWGKIIFPDHPGEGLDNLFPDVPAVAIDLLSKLLSLDPKKRISARQALLHPVFRNSPAPFRIRVAPPVLDEFPSIHQIVSGKLLRFGSNPPVTLPSSMEEFSQCNALLLPFGVLESPDEESIESASSESA